MGKTKDYYKESDRPSEDETKYVVWNVYQDSQNVCLVAEKPSQPYNHKYGPATWQQCWSWINTNCQPSGGVSICRRQ